MTATEQPMRLSPAAHALLRAAHDIASSFIATEHVVVAAAESATRTSEILKRHGLTRSGLLGSGAAVVTGRVGSIPFTPGTKRGLELAIPEAVARGHKEIGVAHIVLAFLRSDVPNGAHEVASNRGIDLEAVIAELAAHVDAGTID